MYRSHLKLWLNFLGNKSATYTRVYEVCHKSFRTEVTIIFFLFFFSMHQCTSGMTFGDSPKLFCYAFFVAFVFEKCVSLMFLTLGKSKKSRGARSGK